MPGYPRDIHEVLKSTWGYDHFRPKQEEVVRSVLAGNDTLALLPTGGGKSLCFQVPALSMDRLCIVVSPLIALMKDQVARLRSKGLRATAIVSGMEHHEIENAIESAAVGKMAFLYVSPERLSTEIFQARLPRLPIGLIAVDEAHCISQWGYDFRPSYQRIAGLREVHPKVPILALTASATAEVAEDIMTRLAFRSRNVVRGSFSRPELSLWISRGEDKMGRLLRATERSSGSGIVYLRERKGTVRIAHYLRQHGVSAEPYHAGMAAEERDAVQQRWTSGETRFVAATNAFGMGIDKADVRTVIHLEPPPDLESYYQEAGRAGRDGKNAYALLFADAGDEHRMREKFASSFHALNEVRRTYQTLADIHRIALGSGNLETYTLDLRAITARTGLSASTVSHCLKALELDGSIALSEGVRSPSRVGMRASDTTVYALRVKDDRLGPVVETLLRMHGGLFEEPSIIDEVRIARHLQMDQQTIVDRLRELDQLRIIFYKQRSDKPTFTLLQPRRDAARLMLDKDALDARKVRAEARMNAMIAFTFRTTHCRERELLKYFNEPVTGNCGRCDNCVRNQNVGAANDAGTMAAEPAENWERARWKDQQA